MALEQSVARHYTHGSLQAAIFDALEASGKDIDRLAPDDLAAVDEFHIGGRQATVDFATQLLPHAARCAFVGGRRPAPPPPSALCRLWGFDGAAVWVGDTLAGVGDGGSTITVGSLPSQRPST
jgi:hypothetical protein